MARKPKATTPRSTITEPAPAHGGEHSSFLARLGSSAATTGATVVRLNTQAKAKARDSFAQAGLRIASSNDFKTKAVPPDLDGADMIVFERFGIGIIESDPGQVDAALQSAVNQRTIVGHRQERIFHALGSRMPTGRQQASGGFSVAIPHPQHVTPSFAGDDAFLDGYLRGVAGLVGELSGRGNSGMRYEPSASAAWHSGTYDETAFTWGLQATGVISSRLTGRDIRVAVLDTGIDLTHPDFQQRPPVTRSFVPDQLDVQDRNGHGTHCAGVVAGPARPSGGGPRYGVAPDVELFIGKVLSDSGRGSDRTVMGGLEWALDSGCEVISMSLGAAVDEDSTFLPEYETIGLDALRSGSIVIAAAGNESARPGLIAPVGSPANCPSIFSVAAVDGRLRVAEFSCGKRTKTKGGEVDIAAPGVDIHSAYLQPEGYARLQGTSMATPFVAGIAALLCEADATTRGLALWGALIRSRRFIGGNVADIGAGLAQIEPEA